MSTPPPPRAASSLEPDASEAAREDTRYDTDAPVSPWLLLRVWLALGLQSFGGGGATLALIYRAVVEQHRWVTDAEFTRDWALCQVAPGINLLGLTILLGRRVAGARGIFLCLLGLLVPSVILTILLTAFYAHIRDSPMVKSALRAVIPASVGLGLLIAYNMARPPLTASRREGGASHLFGFLLIVGSGAALLVSGGQLSVVLILALAGGASALVHWWRDAAAKPPKNGATR